MRASERKVKCYISQNIHLVLAIVMEVVRQKGIQIQHLVILRLKNLSSKKQNQNQNQPHVVRVTFRAI